MDQKYRRMARSGLLSVASLYSRFKTKLSRFPINCGEVP